MNEAICFHSCGMDLVANVEFDIAKDYIGVGSIVDGRVKTWDEFRGYVLDGDIEIVSLDIDGERNSPMDANEEIRLDLEREVIRLIKNGAFSLDNDDPRY